MSEKIKKRWFPWRVLFGSAVIWLLLVSVSAYLSADELGQFNPYYWAPAYLLSLPLSHLALSEFYYYSLYIENYLLENRLLTNFALYSVYWPLMFFLLGVVDWTLIYIIIRTVFRVGRRILFGKKSVPAAVQSAEPAAAQTAGAEPSGKRRFGLRWAGGALLLAAAVWWSYFIITNIERCETWHGDFRSARLLLYRFYHQYGRLPTVWSEIVESPTPPNSETGRVSLKKGEHYAANPGLSDRIDLNFDHLRRINESSAAINDDWIMRVREHSDKNMTGVNDVHYEIIWQSGLVNVIALDRLCQITPREPPQKENAPAPEEKEEP